MVRVAYSIKSSNYNAEPIPYLSVKKFLTISFYVFVSIFRAQVPPVNASVRVTEDRVLWRYKDRTASAVRLSMQELTYEEALWRIWHSTNYYKFLLYARIVLCLNFMTENICSFISVLFSWLSIIIKVFSQVPPISIVMFTPYQALISWRYKIISSYVLKLYSNESPILKL